MSNRRKARPTTGLQGDYTGTCVACLKPTDTGFGTEGEAEWHVVFLLQLGIPRDHAEALVLHGPGGAPAGRYERLWRVCRACMAQSFPNIPPPALAIVGAALPAFHQPIDEEEQ